MTENGNPLASYGYDANGNRVSVNASMVATYDDQDRLLTYENNSYTYNANGELSSGSAPSGTTTYGWDAFGNLTDVTTGSRQIHYIYDGQNRLVGKEVNGSLSEGFLYNGQLQVIAELDGNQNIAEQFVYGTRPNIPDYIIKGGVEYRVISDQVGSPVLIVNASTGAVAEQIGYDAWGNVISDSNPGFQPFGFAGGLYDTDTGLLHFGAREYDPDTGRWISRDPAGFGGGDANLYGYVLGDPINAFDPLGLWRWGDPLPQWLVNGSAGFGDAVSFGFTNFIRNELGTNDVVNKCSVGYFAGEIGGASVNAVLTGAAAARGAAWAAANARPLAKEALLLGTLFTRAPDANVVTPIADMVQAEQNMQTFKEGATLETEAQRLATSHIETPSPGGRG